MRRFSHFTISSIIVLCLVNTVFAQDNTRVNGQRTALAVTAFPSNDRIRFTSPSSVVQIRLEVYSSNGKKVFDNEVRGGNVLDWHLLDGQAEPIADDTYLCAVTVKSLAGKLSQRIGSVTLAKGAVSVKAVDLSQMTAQQADAVGPVEEYASFVVLKEDDRQTPTVISHNGEEGQITRGRGALSFRLGDFFSGKDSEQMRLTAEGNLGIGITRPAVKLDVDGLIRSSQGVLFPDGTIQFSAASKTLGAKSSRSGQKPGSEQDFQTQAAGTGTQNRIAKWIDSSGTLGDSAITETASGFLGIGTPGPDSLLNIQGTVPTLLGHMSVIRTTGSNNGFGLLMDATGSGNNSIGLAVNGAPKGGFSWDNARTFLGFLNFNYSANDFSLRLNSNGSLTYHDSVSSAERFRITAAGNVGIGVPGPTTRLHIGANNSVGGIRVEGPLASGTGLSSFSMGGNGSFSIDAVNIVGGRFFVRENGDVGIGTSNPEYKLDVRSNGQAIHGVANLAGAGVTGTSFSGSGIFGAGVYGGAGTGFGVVGETASGVGVQAFVDAGQPGVFMAGSIFNGPRKFHINNDGTYVAGSDFAEALPARESKAGYAPGDVLVLSDEAPGKVEKASRPYDVRVAGVYSTRPGMLGAEKGGTSRVDANDLPVAIVGIVPTKVSAENGPVQIGDLLTTSGTPGYAMRCDDRLKCFGAIVGKAMAPLTGGQGIINVLVTLR